MSVARGPAARRGSDNQPESMIRARSKAPAIAVTLAAPTASMSAGNPRRRDRTVWLCVAHGSESGVMLLELEDFEQVVRVPCGAFAACLDASLAFVGADEAEGETADDSHVFGAVSASVACEIVAECDIEQPVHALDAPMAAHRCSHALDVGRCGRNEIAGIGATAVVMLGTGLHLDQGLDADEAGLARIAARGHDPVDVA